MFQLRLNKKSILIVSSYSVYVGINGDTAADIDNSVSNALLHLISNVSVG